MNTTIADVLSSKGREIFSIRPDTTVLNALEIMAEKNVGVLLVVSVGQLVGIISERDYARKVALKGLSSQETRVREIMSQQVWYTTPSQSVEEALAVMTEKRVRHLPVFEGGELIGLVSIGDLAKATIAAKDYIISQLENYIQGS